MTRILHRSIAHSYPVAARGEGIHIWDATGKQYIDASGGAAVSCLGHGHPDVLAAMHAQLDKLAYAHTSFFTTRWRRSWAATWSRTRRRASATSISSAAARRRSRRRSRWRGSTSSRSASPSGATSSAATRAITAIRWARSRSAATTWRRKQFAPLLIETHHVSPCFEYRGQRADETPRQYGERLAAELEAKIQELGPKTRDRLRRRDRWRRHGRRHHRRSRATSSASARSATATACC